MKKQFLIIILALICFQGLGQIMFQKLLNSNISDNVGSHEEYGNSIFQTHDGGYIVEGNSINGVTILIKMDQYGDTVWTKNYNCNGMSMNLTSDGGYVITGMPNIYGGLSVRKTDSLGNPVWTKQVATATGYSVKQTTDGGYIIVGLGSDSVSGLSDIFIVKFDAAGTMQWNKNVATASYDGAFSVEQTNTGGYLVAGTTSSFGAGLQDIFLINTDSTGTILWTRTIGTSRNEVAQCIRKTSDNGYIISGITDTSSIFPSNRTLLIKLDSLYNIQWNKAYDGTSYGKNYVEQTIDGGYITSCGGPIGELCLIKTNAIGDTTWTRGFKTSSPTNFANSIHQTTDKGYIITGFAGQLSLYGDIYVIKTDSTGNGLCQRVPTHPTVTSLILTTTSPSPTIFTAGTALILADTISSGAKDSTICSTPQPANSVDEINKHNLFSIYPNPFTSQTTIMFSEEQGITTIKIKDITGREIRTINFRGRECIIEKGEMKAGIYFVIVNGEKKNIMNKKIIIQ